MTTQSQELLAKAKETKVSSIYDLIKSQETELSKALPSTMNPERLSRLVSTNLRMNPKLASCTPLSLLGSMHTAAALGVEPVAGQAYLVPFANKKKVDGEWSTVMECQLILGYAGLVSLFYRHCKSVSLSWGEVKAGDEFEFQKGTEEFLIHKKALTNRGDVIAYWALAKMEGGGMAFEIMSYSEVLEHGKKFSKTYDKKTDTFYSSSPWAQHFGAMALKTVLKQLAKLLPLSIEMQSAINADETSRTFNANMASSDIIDMPPSETNWEEDPEEKQLPEAKEKPQDEFLRKKRDEAWQAKEKVVEKPVSLPKQEPKAQELPMDELPGTETVEIPPGVQQRDILELAFKEYPEDKVNGWLRNKLKYISNSQTYRDLPDGSIDYLISQIEHFPKVIK